MRVQAELSLYPLRTRELAEPIRLFCRSLSERGLEVQSGPMSTRIAGESGDVMDAVQAAFEKAAEDYQLVLTMKLSNACPDEP